MDKCAVSQASKPAGRASSCATLTWKSAIQQVWKPARRTLLALILLTTIDLQASTTGALRDYNEGNYDQAFKEYERLLQRNTNDARLHFNAGASAYRQKHFTEAAKEFDSALTDPDLQLQERAYYNRGNARFRMGEQLPDPNGKSEAWKSALRDFESSYKLDPQDADAKSNYEFVKKKLEELKQQQQQQQSKSDQKQDQQQQQQNQQNQNSQKEQNQQQQQQAQQNQSDKQQQQQQQQAQNQQQQNQAQSQSQTNKDQSGGQKENQQAAQGQQQAAGQPSGEAKEKGEENAVTAVPGQMTPEQARQLLDAQKSDEQLLPLKPEKKPLDHTRPFKDW